MPNIVVHELDILNDATWSFSDSTPTWRHRAHGHRSVFDPFPAYPHDVALAIQTAAAVQEKCPPRWDVELYVADREEVGRSNGYSSIEQGGRYDDNDEWVKEPPVGLIMLSGKRIPPHPAMTRYLVAHEYGHNVEWMLNHLDGHPAQGFELVVAYAQMRGLPGVVHSGSGGRWHDSAAEVFACDFRILVCGIEAEYWPHPGVPHPLDRSLPHDLAGWWADAVERLRAAGPVGQDPA